MSLLKRAATIEPLATAEPVIRVQDVSVRLGERVALRDVTFDLNAGAFVGLLGPNGSGKSTLIRAILGVLPLASGRIEVAGGSPKDARDLFSYLPQRRVVDIEAPIEVWDVVMMGRMRKTGLFRTPSRADREAVAWSLERVGMADRRRSPIGQLSFGQQQRVFFARALAQEGPLLLLDEPMNGVDSRTQDLFVEQLTAFQAEGKTIIMATHDLNMAACVCDTLCFLNQRLVAFGPVAETFTSDVLRAAYGSHLHFVEVDRNGHPEVLEDAHHHPQEGGGGRRAGVV
jgi:manganese/iron transport system ATP-binding protein